MKAIDTTITYAQNREDLYIAAFFPDISKGFYVDIGANHPDYDSVTRYFYDHGWTGINVEPNRTLFELLKSSRTRDKNENVGVSDQAGVLMLREYENHGLSTFATNMQADYDKQANKTTGTYVDRQVKTVTLKELFSKYSVTHIHFLKIDVEGFEMEVLKGNDWKAYRPELICIESNHATKSALQSFLVKNKYQKVFFDGLNDYYLAAESSKRSKLFETTFPDLIVQKTVLPYAWQEHFQNIQKETEHYKSVTKRLETELAQAQAEIAHLQSIKNSAKHLAHLTKKRLTKH